MFKNNKEFSFKRFLSLLSIFAFIGVSVGTVCSLLGKYAWWLDIFSHYQNLYFFTAFVFIFVLLFSKASYRLIAWCALLIVINAFVVLPYYMPQAPSNASDSTKRIKLIQSNVLTMNEEYDLVLDYIRHKNPDVITLQEVNALWMTQLSTLYKDYPYQIVHSREDNFGIALLSKYPIGRKKVLWKLNDTLLPTIISDVIIDESHRVTLLTTHPLPPMGQFESRNRQFDAIADERERKFLPSYIITGDLNCTPWSIFFRDFLKRLDLDDTQLLTGYQPTWPTQWEPFMRMSLDHILVSKDITVLKRELGPDVGSDHLPVYVELAIPVSMK